ncbi:MAG: hypothetical protein HY841_05700 [Bacteroidetes bacterium]|nr:hypothetical protein [Bacteroidota bacterium]
MKRIFFISVLICFIDVLNIVAQEYKTGIGLRGGWTSGLSLKHFISDGKAVEGILSSGYRYRGWQITGLYEIHKPAFTKDDVEGLFWLYGGGAHFGGGYRYDHWHKTGGPWNQGYVHEHNYIAIGIDFIFGIEYKIPDIPFTIGADVKPFFDFVTDRDAPYGFWDSALSIRYVF